MRTTSSLTMSIPLPIVTTIITTLSIIIISTSTKSVTSFIIPTTTTTTFSPLTTRSSITTTTHLSNSPNGETTTTTTTTTTAAETTTTTPPNLFMSRPTPIIPELNEVCSTVGVTLTRFMAEVAMVNPELDELTTIFGAIGTACKAISNLVKRSQLPSSSTLGYQGAVNVQGEDQKKLDVITNDILKRALRFTGRLGVLASEEEDNPVDVIFRDPNGQSSEIVFNDFEQYVAVFDPLDGSSNIDAGCPTGTIIGIYQHDEYCDLGEDIDIDDAAIAEARCLANTLQAGTNLVAAAYCLYSSSTFLTLTLGSGVYMFTLDEQIGEFVLSKPNIIIPSSSSIMSFNDAKSKKWDAPLQNVVGRWKDGIGRSSTRFNSRYIGAMVGDVHRTLLYGGVFGYPADDKNTEGKLRLLYEGAPMSFIMEQAGGLSTTGRERVMEIVPKSVHQRVPIVMGSRDDVQEVIDAYEEWSEGEDDEMMMTTTQGEDEEDRDEDN